MLRSFWGTGVLSNVIIDRIAGYLMIMITVHTADIDGF